MSTLERRLNRLEEALVPPPVQPFCLLVEPPTDAAPEAWEEHRRQIDEAKARGDFVGVVSSLRPQDRPHSEKGVAYYRSEFEALLAKVARLPSKLGNKSLLDDVMKSLPGNVIEPESRRRCVAEKA